MVHLINFSSKIGRIFPYRINRLYCYSPNVTCAKTTDSKKLPAELREALMPQHVAAILDGNRRWARKRGLTYIEGYQAGLVTMRNFTNLCTEWGIPVVSLFLFSSENWRRPQLEVDYLMKVFEEALRDDIPLYMSVGARVTIIGDTSLLPIPLQKQIKRTEEETKNNTKFVLLFAISYGGQDDIVQACQAIAAKVKDGSLEPEDITEFLFEQELQTNVTSMPCPDLLIRTSGEFRISNYYLWQSAYTEIYITDTLWPDFGKHEFIEALQSLQQRGRRFGQK